MQVKNFLRNDDQNLQNVAWKSIESLQLMEISIVFTGQFLYSKNSHSSGEIPKWKIKNRSFLLRASHLSLIPWCVLNPNLLHQMVVHDYDWMTSVPKALWLIKAKVKDETFFLFFSLRLPSSIEGTVFVYDRIYFSDERNFITNSVNCYWEELISFGCFVDKEFATWLTWDM